MVRKPRSRRTGPDALTILLKCIAWPMLLFSRAFLSPLDALLEPRRTRAFAKQLKEIYGDLLAEHDGKVLVESRRQRVMDYMTGELIFPDRRVVITRGRQEVSVTVDGLEVYTSYREDYQTSMLSSARVLARHWNDSLQATAADVRHWAESER